MDLPCYACYSCFAESYSWRSPARCSWKRCSALSCYGSLAESRVSFDDVPGPLAVGLEFRVDSPPTGTVNFPSHHANLNLDFLESPSMGELLLS